MLTRMPSPGDDVLVVTRAIYQRENAFGVHLVTLNVSGQEVRLCLEDLHDPRSTIRPPEKPLEAGDTVRSTLEHAGPHMQRMKVKAVSDDRAWCVSGGYDYIRDVSELERVP